MSIFSDERNLKNKTVSSKKVKEKMKRKGFSDVSVSSGKGTERDTLKGKSKLSSMVGN